MIRPDYFKINDLHHCQIIISGAAHPCAARRLRINQRGLRLNLILLMIMPGLHVGDQGFLVGLLNGRGVQQGILLLFKGFRRLKQGVGSLVYSAAALPCPRASRRRLSSVRIQSLDSLASRCSDSLADCVNRRGGSEVSRFALCELVDAIAKCLPPILIHAAAMLLINGR